MLAGILPGQLLLMFFSLPPVLGLFGGSGMLFGNCPWLTCDNCLWPYFSEIKKLLHNNFNNNCAVLYRRYKAMTFMHDVVINLITRYIFVSAFVTNYKGKIYSELRCRTKL